MTNEDLPAYRAKGICLDRRSTLSRVTRRTECTMLVAPMSSSAGSESMSSSVLRRAMSQVTGHTVTSRSARRNSEVEVSKPMRCICMSLAISHKTIAEIPHCESSIKRSSLGLSFPANAYRKMWVSRLSTTSWLSNELRSKRYRRGFPRCRPGCR